MNKIKLLLFLFLCITLIACKVRQYEVVFLNHDESILKKEIVEKGSSVEAPSDPYLEGYTFVRWDKEFTNVTRDLVIKPIFEEILEFRVSFIDYDGTVLKSETVNKNESANAPDNPTRNGYEFVGWSREFDNVKRDLTIEPIYSLIEYEIKYYDNDKLLKLKPSLYYCTELVFLPDYFKEGYEFIGWFTSLESNEKITSLPLGETGDKVFYAKFEEISVEEKITLPTDGYYFSNIKKVAHSSGVGFVYQPDFTGSNLPTTSVLAYTWTSSDESVALISAYSSISITSSGFALITATLISDPSVKCYVIIKTTPDGVFYVTEEEANAKKTYTVTFKDTDGTIIDTQNVNEGKQALLPTPPIKDGYVFCGWDNIHYNIQKDTVITATYVEGSVNYVGKTVSILGDSISTYKGFIPNSYSYFYPYPTASVTDVNQTWWMQTINSLGMKLLKNNSWSGSCVSSGTGDSSAVTASRINELLDDGVIPDVIIIFMSSNDCASQYVSLEIFKTSYKLMLSMIKSRCPESEVILCTLPPSGLYDNDSRVLYNEVILDCALVYGLGVINFSDVYNGEDYKQYLCDSAHPNRLGMNLFSKKALDDLIK